MFDIIFVSDFFVEHIQGGAELTSEALIQSSPYKIEKVQSSHIDFPFVQENKEKFWIFGNFAHLDERIKLEFIKNMNYSIVEYDYKYCRLRSDDIHKIYEGECNCEREYVGKINSLFFKNAKSVWWMSKKQMDFYHHIFPFLEGESNNVLSSVFSKTTIDEISNIDTKNKSDKWIILNSPSPIKNVNATIEYAKMNDLEFELVWDMKYDDLLKKLGRSKGLIFLPQGKDTCPRITIEAKLLDCELVLNENVQHKDEPWFKTKESILNHLSTRTEKFWKGIERNVECLEF